MEDPALLSITVYQSDAYKTYLRFHSMGINYSVFERNYEELRRLLIAAQNPDTFDELWIQGKENEMMVIVHELIRLLHNFIASAKMLVDHTRAVIDDWYSETEFLKEYKSEVQKRFVNNPVTGFIEDLRNYALHFRLPLTNARFQVTIDPDTQEQVSTQTFVLDKSDLMQWSNWTNKGKPYLKASDASDKEIVVLELIDQYYQEIRSFHDWIRGRLEDIHADQINWLNEMEEKTQKALKKRRNISLDR